MNLLLLAQTAPIKLITESPAATPDVPAAPAAALIDPLWVLLALVTTALVVGGVLIGRLVWVDLLTRRPADAAYWLLAVRRGLWPWQMGLLRRAAGERMHPVAVLCSPVAREACVAAYARTGPPTREAARLARIMRRIERAEVGGLGGG